MLPSERPVGPAPKEKAMPTVPPPDAARKFRWHAAPPRPAPVEYPESDGKPMAETDIHRRVIIDVATMLSTRYRGREDMFVGGDLMMYYEEGAANLYVSPDIFVAFGPPREPPRRVWKTWEEGKLADFVLEVTSKGTRRKDEEKRRLFQRLGVAEYWQHDPTGEYMPAILKGQRLNAARTYEAIPLIAKPDGMLHGESKVLSLSTSASRKAACAFSTRPRTRFSPRTRRKTTFLRRRTTFSRSKPAKSRNSSAVWRPAKESLTESDSPMDRAPTTRHRHAQVDGQRILFACREDQNPARKLMASKLTLVLMFPGRTNSFGCWRNSNSR